MSVLSSICCRTATDGIVALAQRPSAPSRWRGSAVVARWHMCTPPRRVALLHYYDVATTPSRRATARTRLLVFAGGHSMPCVATIDTVSEWSRRWTRNPLGSACKGFKSPRCRAAMNPPLTAQPHALSSARGELRRWCRNTCRALRRAFATMTSATHTASAAARATTRAAACRGETHAAIAHLAARKSHSPKAATFGPRRPQSDAMRSQRCRIARGSAVGVVGPR